MGTGYELGRAVEFLIHEGHDEDRVWRYTPRQVKGWIEFAMRRRIGERRDALFIATQGARGNYKEVKKMLKDMGQESR